jgi:serine/threonine protein kinase
MELIEGEPLSALLARAGRLGLERSLDIVAQAALAVGAAHRVGLVHRDISRATCSCAVTGGEGEATFECALPPAVLVRAAPRPAQAGRLAARVLLDRHLRRVPSRLATTT